MRSPFTLAALAGAALLSWVLAVTVLSGSRPPNADRFQLEVTLTSTASGQAQCYYDLGGDFSEANSAAAAVTANRPPAIVRFPLPAGSLHRLRFDPLDREGTVQISEIVLRRPGGGLVKRFALADVVAANQIASTTVAGANLRLETVRGATDPFVFIQLGTPVLALENRWLDAVTPSLGRAAFFFAVLSGALFGLARLAEPTRVALRERAQATRKWLRQRPGRAISLAAFAAVILSSYPVIFGGASFVSPNYGTTLLYEGLPTLPGSRERELVDARGADVGAIMWQQVPQARVQRDALLRDFEWPLWNRYNAAGTPLLGQGQSMAGDPLHWGVVLAGGAAWAWDLKFLAAKWLLGAGLGFIVWLTARHLGAAALVAFASVFAGFFVFRVNHPAVFTFCYGPLVLLAWCHLLPLALSRRGLVGSLLGLVAANWLLFTSGTMKEAVVSLLVLNLAGVALVLGGGFPWRERLVRLAAATAAGGVFLLLSAPLWLTFLDTLRASYSTYAENFAFQLNPGLAIGFFDEIFLRPFWDQEQVFDPSTNFLILGGVLAFLVNLRRLAQHRAAVALGLVTLVPVAFVFGFVPPQWIASWPLLGNIHHIDNSFGVPLLHLFAVLAGFGFAALAPRLGGPEGRGDIVLAALLLGALVVHYVGLTQTVQRSTHTFLLWGQEIAKSPFVWASLLVLPAALVCLALGARRLLGPQPTSAAAVLLVLSCAVALLWRHGLQSASAFPRHTLGAAPRADFDATSAAVQAVQRDATAPARVVGFGATLFPGWNDAYGLEGIAGPDALMNPFLRELPPAFGIERAWDWRLVIQSATLPAVRPFCDLLGVRYFLNRTDGPAPVADGLLHLAHADLDVYRSESAWPRAFFTDRLATYQTVGDFAALVRNSDHRPLAAAQSGEHNLPGSVRSELAGRAIVPAAQYRLTNNTTSFEVTAPSAGVIVLTEAWVPDDFIVRINDQEAPYFRVNHAFKGVTVPRAGTYRVSFRYRPHRFNLALVAAVIGALCAGAAWWWAFRSKSSPPHRDGLSGPAGV